MVFKEFLPNRFRHTFNICWEDYDIPDGRFWQLDDWYLEIKGERIDNVIAQAKKHGFQFDRVYFDQTWYNDNSVPYLDIITLNFYTGPTRPPETYARENVQMLVDANPHIYDPDYDIYEELKNESSFYKRF